MDQITQISLDDLHESPFNPRKHYDEQSLRELAEDIKSHGRILQPLLVRPRVPELFRGTDDPAAAAGYELVFGHRRLRAATLAGLLQAPCMVRSMTDIEVKRAQISENLQRKDVHPIEEAEGFQALMADHGETADTITAQTGKSRSYVYGRLKLLQACPQVRAACVKGEIGSEVALLIARLRHTKLQERALKAIEAKYLKMDDGGKKSYREIKRLLADMFTLDLKGAIFDTEDAALVASAGVCSACDKLSGNAPEFTDLAEKRPGVYPGHFEAGNTNLCTDPTCWDTKHKAHLVREAERMRAEGKVVVDGNKARAALGADGKTVKGAYVALADVKAALKVAGKKQSDLPVVNIQDQRTGKTVQAVASAELKAIGVAMPEAPKPSHSVRALTPAEREKIEQEKAENARRARRLMLTCIAKLRQEPRSAEDFTDVVQWALEQIYAWGYEAECLAELWGYDDYRALTRAAATMSTAEQSVLLMTLVMADGAALWLAGHSGNPMPDAVGRIAQAHGIDVDLAMAVPMPDEVASTPSAAAQAQEEDAGGEPVESTAALAPAGRASGARYRNALTGETWSGRGLKPRWLKVALENGQSLADFDTQAPAAGAAQAGTAGREVTVDAGSAGKEVTVDAAGYSAAGGSDAIAEQTEETEA